jgi:hypothetical protein
MFKKLPYNILSIWIAFIGCMLMMNVSNTWADQVFDFGASPETSIQIDLVGGTNQNNRKTFLTAGAIDFGSVSFIHPELIANGDAYVENGVLKLESIINVELIFNGADSVRTSLSKLRVSSNPFSKSYYSLSTTRSHSLTEILEDPNKNDLGAVTEPSTLTVRVVFDILPSQKGRISDRFKLEAVSQ